MASYFSSFTSSSAISNFSTRFNSLRRAISSGDETDDPENEDCSHISNVLRAYYTEKGRRLPPWLPPDPKSPAPPPVTIATAQTSMQGYGGRPDGLPPPAGRGAPGGGLGDLWGEPAPPSQRPPPTASLRAGRSMNQVPQQATLQPPSAGGAALTRPATSTGASSRSPAGFFDRLAPQSSAPPDAPSARPLPSQRAGSYQNTVAASQGRSGGLDRTISAQDRLRARLHGGSSSSGISGSSPSPGYGSQYSGSSPYGGGGDTGGYGRRPAPRGPR